MIDQYFTVFSIILSILLGIIGFFLKNMYTTLTNVSRTTDQTNSKVAKIETTLEHTKESINKSEGKIEEHNKLMTSHHAKIATLMEFKKNFEKE